MTPKEKAEELVNKFMNYADAVPEDYDWMDPVSHCDGKQFISAKQCVLIAVDEILNNCLFEFYNCGFLTLEPKHKEYWEQVRKEIENL